MIRSSSQSLWRSVLGRLQQGGNGAHFRFMSSGTSHKLFIGGLTWGTDDNKLRDAFSSYGEIVEAKVITDRESGRSKGFGFVSFMSTEDAEKAKNGMDGQDLDGRNVRVDFAVEKPPTARAYGGGSGGYGGGAYGSGGGYGGGGGFAGGDASFGSTSDSSSFGSSSGTDGFGSSNTFGSSNDSFGDRQKFSATGDSTDNDPFGKSFEGDKYGDTRF